MICEAENWVVTGQWLILLGSKGRLPMFRWLLPYCLWTFGNRFERLWPPDVRHHFFVILAKISRGKPLRLKPPAPCLHLQLVQPMTCTFITASTTLQQWCQKLAGMNLYSFEFKFCQRTCQFRLDYSLSLDSDSANLDDFRSVWMSRYGAG